MSNGNFVTERLEFIKFDRKSSDDIRGLKPVLEKHLPEALDRFYAHISHVPQVSRFFTGAEHMARAKGNQLKHWGNIAAANFGDDYGRSVRVIGETHARIGLEPRWYIGGYALIADLLIKACAEHLWPRELLGRGGKAEAAGATLGALIKAIFLDMDLAISIYIEAAEDARRKSEAAAAEERKRAEEERAREAKKQAVVVEAMSEALSKLAAGDLTFRITAQFSPEYKALQADFNGTVVRLNGTIATIATATQQVTSAASEISVSTTDLSQRTEQQAAGIEQTSASMEQIAATVKKNAENAKHAEAQTRAAHEVANRGGEVVANAVSAMGRIEESSRKISEIIGVIDEIARQTNLLALNAAVEAARAGESGRGFAVVAQEVRSLAQRASQAAKDIKDLITGSATHVSEGVELVRQAGETLGEIVHSIDAVAKVVEEFTAASAEQSAGIEQVHKALTQMDEVTQQNSALVEENAATAKALENQAEAVGEQLAFFRYQQDGTAQTQDEHADAGPARLRA